MIKYFKKVINNLKIKKIADNFKKTKDNLTKAKEKVGIWHKEISCLEVEVGLLDDLWGDLGEQHKIPPIVVNSGQVFSQSLFRQSGYLLGSIRDSEIEDTILGVKGITNTASTMMVSGTAVVYHSDVLPESHSKLMDFVRQGSQREEISRKLNAINPNLAAGYNKAWDNLYTSLEDRGRDSMFLMREVLRRLYDYLAPKEKVKNFYNVDKAERHHQIEYIASKIKNPDERKVFLNEEKSYTYVYNLLCEAHKPEELNIEKVESAMYQADDLIKRTLNHASEILGNS